MFNAQIDNRLKDIKGTNQPFGGVSIIAIGDLFQLQPVMDGYVFNDLNNSEYAVLAPNLWKEYFQMFELLEIMRQRESKVFAEILNRLHEGKHTPDDLLKLKDRLLQKLGISDPMNVPHLFIQNAKVNEFNRKAHQAFTGPKFSIEAQDSVIGADSQGIKDKVLRQIPDDPRKTKQLQTRLSLAEGERTEICINELKMV